MQSMSGAKRWNCETRTNPDLQRHVVPPWYFEQSVLLCIGFLEPSILLCIGLCKVLMQFLTLLRSHPVQASLNVVPKLLLLYRTSYASNPRPDPLLIAESWLALRNLLISPTEQISVGRIIAMEAVRAVSRKYEQTWNIHAHAKSWQNEAAAAEEPIG